MHIKSEILPVTVAIPVRNEEANLNRCLQRLSRFSEVVVIDSSSTDRTKEIAEKLGVRVVNFQWNGQFPKKRNWFLLNETLNQPWVLFLDADEFVDDTFCDTLSECIQNDHINGFWIKYSNVFMGRKMRYGVQQRKLALFRVGSAFYEKIEEEGWTTLDMEVHEHPIVDGKVAEIISSIEHHDFKGLGHFILKHRDYAVWEARRFVALKNTQGAWANFTRRQRFKYRYLEKWWYPWFYFLFTYIIKQGFRDGRQGFHYAFYKLWYFQTIRLLIQEVK